MFFSEDDKTGVEESVEKKTSKNCGIETDANQNHIQVEIRTVESEHNPFVQGSDAENVPVQDEENENDTLLANLRHEFKIHSQWDLEKNEMFPKKMKH